MSPSSDSPSPQDQEPSPEMLPEVQPPTTGFILQLFIIPGLIVLAIVLVYLMIGWVADSGGNPQEYFAEVKRGRSNSWQQALTLAQTLQSDPNSRNDSDLARQIAEYLDVLLDQSLSDNSESGASSVDERAQGARLRQYLCIALVNFKDVETTLPVLLKAAGMDHRGDDNYVKVRVGALQAIATLAERARTGDETARRPFENPAVLATLGAVVEEDELVLRNQGAIALGTLGGDAAVELLEEMAINAQEPNVRYNIATSLARNGRASAIPLLVEMLQPSKVKALPRPPDRDGAEKEAEEVIAQRLALEKLHVVNTALQAVPVLASANPELDLSDIIEVLEELPKQELPRQIQLSAEQVLRDLQAAK